MTDPDGRYVLIVEDQDYLAEIVSRIMQQIGLGAVICLTAEDAITYMEQHVLPDLIVLDISMPGMSGWDFLDVIKQYEETKLIPVIVTTARSDAANRLVGRLRNVDRYFVKPYHPEELLNAARQSLGIG
ncbi:MAG: response regulator [Chloroflexota bacterium]